MRFVFAAVAAAAIAGAVVFALLGYGGSTTTSAATISLGAPTNDTPSSPTGQFTRTGSVLRQGGKPELLFVGALYCPHCGVERWAIVKALSQFGAFSHVRGTTNGQGVPTFDLTGAQYASRYVAFVHKDVEDQSYTTLQSLSPQEQSLFSRYDPTGVIPMILVGGYAMNNSPIDPSVIDGKSFATVENGLKRGSHTSFVRDINAEANVVTALLCHADGMQPRSACGRHVVRGLTTSIP